MKIFLFRKGKRYVHSGTMVCFFLLGVCWIFYSVALSHSRTTRDRRTQMGPFTVSAQQQMITHTVSINTQRRGIMDQRKAHLQRMCNRRGYKRPYREHILYNKDKQFIFCKATKAGSTFWGRLLLQVDRHVIADPYKIKPQIGPINVIPNLRQWPKFDEILQSSTKFIIARNPLERLFSGYVDKVYSPNPHYWKAIGTYIIKAFRKTSNRSCGHDVTFPEFLQYAVHAETTGKNRDVHVASLWETCSPCHVNYDIIGKMETFKDDTDYILDKLNLEPYKAVLRNISVDAVNDALYDTAQAYVSMRTSATECISEQETVNRIWTKLKTRGFIAAEFPVPSELYNKNETEVFEIFKDKYHKSVVKLGRDGLKNQRKAIYFETLRKLPDQMLTQVVKAYHMDFEMFGYDQKFDYIFRESTSSDFSVSNSFILH